MPKPQDQFGGVHAVVVLSGGMDSTVCATLAVREHGPEAIAALHIDYGQRTESRERMAFEDVCDRLGIARRLVVQNQALSQIGGSALTDSSLDVPEAGPEIGHQVPITYVPFRNAHFLAVAVSWAEVLGAEKIYIGAVQQDSSGYPDCRPEYYQAFNEVIRTGTKDGNIQIFTPLIHLRKAEIVQLGLELAAPFDLTWSCYSREDSACGVCESCALRLRAFEAAGTVDPISYLPQAARK
ncbi:MAG: 7-cyano-7-deazaguanine synthase QueC [Acidobacteriaceae bacterium]